MQVKYVILREKIESFPISWKRGRKTHPALD